MSEIRMIECLRCGLLKPHKSRYLCLACYQHPDGKKYKIPMQGRVEREDWREANRQPATLEDEPTDHPPGSAGKILVMARRWKNNQKIFHPEDAGFDED